MNTDGLDYVLGDLAVLEIARTYETHFETLESVPSSITEDALFIKISLLNPCFVSFKFRMAVINRELSDVLGEIFPMCTIAWKMVHDLCTQL